MPASRIRCFFQFRFYLIEKLFENLFGATNLSRFSRLSKCFCDVVAFYDDHSDHTGRIVRGAPISINATRIQFQLEVFIDFASKFLRSFGEHAFDRLDIVASVFGDKFDRIAGLRINDGRSIDHSLFWIIGILVEHFHNVRFS